MSTRARHEESGFATILVMIIIVLITVIVGVLMQAADAERRDSTRTLSRSEQIAIADTAASRYLLALNTKYASRATNFQLTTTAFTAAASPLRKYFDRKELRIYSYPAGATQFTGNSAGRQCTTPSNKVPTPAVVRREGAAGAPWTIDDSASGGGTRFVIEEDHPGRPCAYWEVYRVDPLPLSNLSLNASSHRHIGIIFRVWMGGTGTRPRYVRTTLSRGSFSDYQLLTDEAITFGNNVNIVGKVHSNNYDEAPTAIQGPASLQCWGNESKVTSRTGGISLGGSKPLCRAQAATGKAIDLGAMEEALAEVNTACAQDPTAFRYRCFGPLGSQGYRVYVGNPLVVTNATTGGHIATISHGTRPYTLRFNEDRVYVVNGASPVIGSVSVFASSDDVAHITVEGSSFGPPPSGKPVVGLLAQGDIVVGAASKQGTCAGGVTINAAMMAETGTLTVPHKWLSQIRQQQTPKCGTLNVNGAIATRTAPVLQLRWGGVDYGFANRSLNWNLTLKRVVPPMFPATGPWEMATWREANHDCLSVNIPAAGSECAL